MGKVTSYPTNAHHSVLTALQLGGNTPDLSQLPQSSEAALNWPLPKGEGPLPAAACFGGEKQGPTDNTKYLCPASWPAGPYCASAGTYQQ